MVSDEAWRLLEPRLPGPFLWFYWDRCEALRIAISDLFMDRNLSPIVFSRIAQDDDVFSETAYTACKTYRGTRFIRRVKEALESGVDERHDRVLMLEKLLK